MKQTVGEAATRCGLFFLFALLLATEFAEAACDFRPPLANDVPLGLISPAQAGNVVGSITLRFRCTRGDSPAFSFIGSNDEGPGLHRMRNLTQPSEYLPYSIQTNMPNIATLTVTITVGEADFREAWVGNYEDTLFVSVTP